MNYKKVIFIFISVFVLAAIIVGVSVVWQQKQRSQQSLLPTEEGRVTITSPVTTEPLSDELVLQQQVADLIKTKDFAQCDQIADEMYKTVCVNNIALNLAEETEDIRYCQKLDDKLVSRAECEQRVVFSRSIEKESIAICAEATNQDVQRQCEERFYLSLSLKKKDVNICAKISDQQKSDLCRDAYIIEVDFTKDLTSFNCSVLKNNDAQADCKSVQDVKRANANTQNAISVMNVGNPNMNKCPQLKTNLFLRWCL